MTYQLIDWNGDLKELFEEWGREYGLAFEKVSDDRYRVVGDREGDWKIYYGFQSEEELDEIAKEIEL